MSRGITKQWFEKPIRAIGVNLWAPEWYHASITKFDAEKVADALARTGMNVGFTFQGFTQDHFGLNYFPTKLGHRHKNLAGRDHIGEYMDALHKRNIKVFGYYSFQWDNIVWKHNPDWRQKDSENNDIITGGGSWGLLCPNGPYHDHAIARIREIVANYKLDGLLVDTVELSTNPTGCYCTYCQRKFKERFGRDLPCQRDGCTEDWQRFIQWRYSCIEELFSEIRGAVKEIRSDIVLTHNAFALRERDGWGPGENYERTLQYDDIIQSIASCEGQIEDKQIRHTDLIWKTGLLTRFLRGIGRKPVWIQIGRFPYSRDYQTLPVHELKLTAYSVVVNGGSPCYLGNLFPDGSIDEIACERMGEVYREIESKAKYLDYTDELTFAGLYFSRSSQDYYDLTYPGEQRYLSSFEGAYKILIEGKIPFQIVGESGLDLGQLAKYKILIIPAAISMDDEQIAIIDSFVRRGGTLISTARTSLVDGKGRSRPNFGLSKIFCADYVNPLNYSTSFIQPTDHPICEGIDIRENILHRGCQTKVAPHDGAKIVSKLALPVTEVVPGVRWLTWCGSDVPVGDTTPYPAALASTVDEGRCVYFSGDITGVYGMYGYPSLRSLFLNAIKWCCSGAQPLVVSGPLSLESHCFIQGNRYIIHLLNYTTSCLRLFAKTGGSLAEEGIPCRDISIKLQLNGKSVRRAYLVSSAEDVVFEITNGAIVLSVPEVNVHEIVVVECERL